MTTAKSDLTKLVGTKIGRLTVKETWIDRTSKNHKYHRWIMCDCDCGTINHVTRYAVGRQAQSCGCLLREWRSDWGKARRRLPPEHVTSNAYFGRLRRRYGYSSVMWSSYQEMIADMGVRPDGKILMRNDPELPFSKSNCSRGWLTNEEARHMNARGSTPITVRGVTRTIREWAQLANIKQLAFEQWLTRKWTGRGKGRRKVNRPFPSEDEIAAYLDERIERANRAAQTPEPALPQSKVRAKVRSRD